MVHQPHQQQQQQQEVCLVPAKCSSFPWLIEGIGHWILEGRKTKDLVDRQIRGQTIARLGQWHFKTDSLSSPKPGAVDLVGRLGWPSVENYRTMRVVGFTPRFRLSNHFRCLSCNRWYSLQYLVMDLPLPQLRTVVWSYHQNRSLRRQLHVKDVVTEPLMTSIFYKSMWINKSCWDPLFNMNIIKEDLRETQASRVIMVKDFLGFSWTSISTCPRQGNVVKPVYPTAWAKEYWDRLEINLDERNGSSSSNDEFWAR